MLQALVVCNFCILWCTDRIITEVDLYALNRTTELKCYKLLGDHKGPIEAFLSKLH